MSKKKTAKKSKFKKDGTPRAKPKYNQNSAIRSALRRSFSRSPIVKEVLQEGRREVPKYKKDGTLSAKPGVQYHCQVCQRWTPSTKIAVDHIEPVIPADGTFTDWNTFVDRLWCEKSNLQRICDDCHAVKTEQERVFRKTIMDDAKRAELAKLIVE